MIHVQIDCPATAEMVEFLDQICEWTVMRVNQTESKKLVLAAHEAIINSVEAMRRCYSETYQEKKISLKIYVKKDEIIINVIDSAGGIPLEVQNNLDKRCMEDIVWEEDGRGILFMRHLVDDVWQDNGEDGRFIMGLRKRVTQDE